MAVIKHVHIKNATKGVAAESGIDRKQRFLMKNNSIMFNIRRKTNTGPVEDHVPLPDRQCYC
jgi:hypothetical protein